MLFDGTTLRCYKASEYDGPILHLVTVTSFAALNSLAQGLQTGNFLFRQTKLQLPTAIKKKKGGGWDQRT